MWWEIPDHLEVINHSLYLNGINVWKLAKTYGTPLYVMNGGRIEETYTQLLNCIRPHLKRKLNIHYAIKANSNIAVLKLLEKLGSSVDAVSPFEVLVAEKAGYTRDRILCTGTSFSNDDMITVAEKAVMNIDSISQLKRYAKLVSNRGFDSRISIRINPGKGVGHCPECITAGKDAKYGVPEYEALSAYKEAVKLGLTPIGIHQHIGSGFLSHQLNTFYECVEKLLDIAGKIKEECNINFEFLDFGGGIGIPYRESDGSVDLESFGENFGVIVEEKAEENGLYNFVVYLEPGRFMVGDSAILLTRVVDKNLKYVSELGVDAGFNIFDRPARYGAYHEIVNVEKADLLKEEDYRISGNLCESGDVFTESKHHLRKLPRSEEGDVLAILNAGAYGSTMSSNYNMRPRAREILVYNRNVSIMREKDCFEDVIRNQRL